MTEKGTIKKDCLIGISGWNYDSFIGSIYPSNLKKSRYLEHYATYFNTVELNASFYHSFPNKTWQGWYDRTPKNFKWAVKASRFITHIKRLDVTKDSINRFFLMISPLKEKLEAVLFQLPPTLEYSKGLLEDFLELLPGNVKIAMEFRNKTWFRNDVFDILKLKNVAFVISHTAGKFPMSKVITASFAYIRLHGPQTLYRGEYGREGLKEWVDLVDSFNGKVLVYFDNTADGSAVKDALLFKSLLHEKDIC